jgi:hypothetical protein
MSIYAIQRVIIGGVRTYPHGTRKSEVTVARNLGVPLRSSTTANFDFIPHYRPLMNVVNRPTAASNPSKGKGFQGFAFVVRREILLPLLAAALVAGRSGRGKRSKR